MLLNIFHTLLMGIQGHARISLTRLSSMNLATKTVGVLNLMRQHAATLNL
jgi:hypothetical protein